MASNGRTFRGAMNGTQLSIISEEGSQYANNDTNDTNNVLSTPASAPPALTTLQTPTTPTSKSKAKKLIDAAKRRSSDFFDSFKRAESRLQTHSSDLNDTFAALYGDGMRDPKLSQRHSTQGDPPSKFGRSSVDKGELYFRCDVHAGSAMDFAGAERECKQLVIEAGGRVLSDFDYIGGFLYALPATATTINPLDDGDETRNGGHITIRPWASFDAPEVDGAASTRPGISNAQPASPKRWPQLVEAAKKQKARSWVLREREQVEQTRIQEREEVHCETEDGEPVLGPRILDPGVELAIVDPHVLDSRASSSDGSDDVEVYDLAEAETAICARPIEVYI